MIIIKTLPLLYQKISLLHKKNKSIALVPTMGNLHDGHIKLVNEAKSRADIVVVTIFINPMQFDRIEDLKCYPRTLQEDYKKLKEHYVDFVFVPSLSDIYPLGIESATYVKVPNISNILEGASRPGHFCGVSTIVSKLFNLIQPNIACFGEKDYQQLILIRKMVADMGYNIKIISVPTVRAEDGLALSSRNHYLTGIQRKIAPNLNRVINIIAENMLSNKFNLKEIINVAEQTLRNKGFHTNEIKICDANSLLELTKNSKSAVILVTSWLDQVRLIDNKVVKLKQ